MSEDGPNLVRGTLMDDEDIDEFLRAQGHGTLTLADDGETYGVPISFGYDGERLYMKLIRYGDESVKFDFVDTTDRASVVTYDIPGRFEWESVIVRGELRDINQVEAEHVKEAIAENAWFPPGTFSESEPATQVRWLALDIDEATGRQGVASK